MDLSILPPDTDIYIDVNYRYYNYIKDEEGKVDAVKETKVVLDKLPLHTLPIQNNVQPVAAIYELPELAEVYPDRVLLNGLLIRNTSDYQEDDPGFENLKKNTLPYVARVVFSASRDGGQTYTECGRINSTALKKLLNGEAQDVLSDSVLESQTDYLCKMTAYDKFGNEIPMNAAGQIWQARTCKKEPVGEVRVIANSSGNLQLNIDLTDEDDSIVRQDSKAILRLLYQGEPVSMNGTVAGTSFEGLTEVPLSLGDQNVTVTNLLFSKNYTFEVLTDCNMNDRYGVRKDYEIGTGTFVTAPIANGSMIFNNVMTEISGTYASVQLTVNEKSTANVFELLTAFEVTLKPSGGEGPSCRVGAEQVKALTADDYNDSAKAFVVQKRDDAKDQPGIQIVADVMVLDKYPTLWDAIFAGEASIGVQFPDGSLPQSTKHMVIMRSLIEQMGETYEIPTTVSNNTFNTLKKNPTVTIDDTLLINDFMELYGLHIQDNDGVIINKKVTLKLKMADSGTVMAVQKIEAGTTYEKLRFDHLIPGAMYELELIADEYNLGSTLSTYRTNEVFKTYTLEAASKLRGELSIESMGYGDSSNGVSMDNGTVLDGILNAQGGISEKQGYRVSDYIEYDPEKTYVITGATNSVEKQSIYICFYKEENGEKKLAGKRLMGDYRSPEYSISPLRGNAVEDAVYLRYSFPEANEDGARVTRYDKVSDNVITEELLAEEHKYAYAENGAVLTYNTTDLIPVEAGGLYLRVGDEYPYVCYYSTEKRYMGQTVRKYPEELIRIPRDCGYIVISYDRPNKDKQELYQLGSSTAGADYEVEMKVRLEDAGSYLEQEPDYTLTIKQSDSYRNVDYTVDLKELTNGFNGEGEPVKVMEAIHALGAFTPDNSYEVQLSVIYRGQSIVLDTLNFRTDAAYDVIRKESDLLKLRQNPGGNYRVIEDFAITQSWNINFGGTIDFDGHTITPRYRGAHTLFYTLLDTAVVENLQVDYVTYYDDNGNLAGTNFQLARNNRGTIRNLMVHYSQEDVSSSTMSQLIYENSIRGRIENFALYVDGTYQVASGLLTYQNMGTIDSGYYEIKSGGRLVLGHCVYPYTGNYSGTLAAYGGQTSVVQNVFGIGDCYYRKENIWNPSAIVDDGNGKLSNAYVRGDFYVVDSNGGVTLSKSAKLAECSRTNTYSISENTYETYSSAQAAIANLYDVAWQKSVLGEGDFEIDQSVSMGFYPRVNFPVSMQGSQPYISLPLTLAGKDIKILSSKVVEESLNTVTMEISLANPKGAVITGLEIKDLTATVAEQTNRDGETTLTVILSNPQTYVSSYQVTRIFYGGSGASQAVASDHKLAVKFYKEIATVAEWSEIKRNPSWNYRLIKDIYFGDTGNSDYIVVTGTFSGTLDGRKFEDGKATDEMWSVSGIRIRAKDPSVFETVTGTIQNLLVEDLTLEAREGCMNSGFIKTLGGTLDNVHVRNASVTGAGAVGGLAANASGTIRNCSVADTQISDLSGSIQTLSMGGLVGRHRSAGRLYIQSSYGKGLALQAIYSPSADGVGGLLGSSQDVQGRMDNCYVEGTINTTLNNVGGVCGNLGLKSGNSMFIGNCWSQVQITTKGSVTGGIVGKHTTGTVNTVLALGSINSSGTDVYRISASESGYGYYSRAYAFEGQMFNGESRDRMDATALVTAKQLTDPTYWQDEMLFGTGFDYSSLPMSVLPKVYATNGGLVYGQEDIIIQGVGYEVTLESAEYREGRYFATFKVVHEDVDRQDLDFIITIDGIGIEGQPFGDQETSEISREDTTLITVQTDQFYKAFDSYQATVQIKNKESDSLQSYGVSVAYMQSNGEPYITYWTIKNLNEWNSLMKDHGENQENVKIDGIINMGNRVDYAGLRLGRLEGVRETGCGFKGIKQETLRDGNLVWIEMAGDVKDLSFEDFMVNFTEKQTASRSATGVIATAFSVENVTIKTGRLVLNQGATSNVGFFGKVAGNISHVTAQDVQINKTGNTSPSIAATNVGLICGYLEGTLSDCQLTGTNNTINLPTGSNVGGMVGRQTCVYAEMGESQNTNLSAKHVTITAREYAGGIVGTYMPYGKRMEQAAVSDIKLEVKNAGAGGVIGNGGYSVNMDGITADQVTITIDSTYEKSSGDQVASSGLGGGVAGYLYGTLKNCTVTNAKLIGPNAMGGVVGNFSSVSTGENLSVKNAVVTARAEDQEKATGQNAGGIM
ncbi:MAG: hypothetical protein ACLTKI_07170, partial [Lachnospiraceae bacterium]